MWDPLRDEYRPYYDSSTGEVGYLTDRGGVTLRVTLPRRLNATEGEIAEQRPTLKTLGSDDYLIELDGVEHFE